MVLADYASVASCSFWGSRVPHPPASLGGGGGGAGRGVTGPAGSLDVDARSHRRFYFLRSLLHRYPLSPLAVLYVLAIAAGWQSMADCAGGGGEGVHSRHASRPRLRRGLFSCSLAEHSWAGSGGARSGAVALAVLLCCAGAVGLPWAVSRAA